MGGAATGFAGAGRPAPAAAPARAGLHSGPMEAELSAEEGASPAPDRMRAGVFSLLDDAGIQVRETAHDH